MSVAGNLVRNPIWNDSSEAELRSFVESHHPGGLSPPQIMHLDMFLIRRNDERGHGQLDTYFSRDWGTYLLNFRLRLPAEKRSRRNLENAQKFARRWSLKIDAIKVQPLPGMYVVSVKPHPRYRDGIIYVIEFCSVVLADASGLPTEADRNVSPDDPRPFRKWLDLDGLRHDRASWAVNGDVIRAFTNCLLTILVPFQSP